MRESRTTILETIKRRSTVTVNELAADMSLSAVTIRHHLYALMAEGWVERVPLRRGVGRPQHGYSLTAKGQRQFPSRYHVLTTQLLNVLKNLKSEADVEYLLETTVRQLLELPEDADNLTPEQRLRQLEQHFHANDIPIRLSFAEAREHASLELSCPYYYVSQHHPELCNVDKKVIEDTLQLPLERTSCLLDGDKSCTFNIQLVDIRDFIETGSD